MPSDARLITFLDGFVDILRKARCTIFTGVNTLYGGLLMHPKITEVDFTGLRVAIANPNFAAMAEAVGVRGIRIEDPAKVDDAIVAALAHDGPVLVDAVVNRTELACRSRSPSRWRRALRSTW
jgi:thiamine pyrophosphate-dependent acetolactate synthase large subunit-like protein